eukprot:g2700.t1
MQRMIVRRVYSATPRRRLTPLTRSRSFNLVIQYGRAGLVTHYSCSAVIISGLFVATKYGLDTKSWLAYVPIPDMIKGEDAPEDEGTLDSKAVLSRAGEWLPDLAGSHIVFDGALLSHANNPSSSLNTINRLPSIRTPVLSIATVAFAIYKVIFPLRAMMTTALTPIVVRYLRKKHPKSFLLRDIIPRE